MSPSPTTYQTTSQSCGRQGQSTTTRKRPGMRLISSVQPKGEILLLHLRYLAGRDCIANKSSLTFDCQTSCDGIYADIAKWTEPLDTIQPLISEYDTFKENIVRHFIFNTSSASTNFGRCKILKQKLYEC